MNYFTQALKYNGNFRRLVDSLKKGKSSLVHGLVKESTGHFLLTLIEEGDRPIILVAENPKRTRELYDQVQSIGGDSVLYFPENDYNFFNMESLSYETLAKRIDAMDRLAEGDKVLVVTNLQALKKPLSPVEDFRKEGFTISIDQEMDPEDLVEALTDLHYEQVTTVEHKGQYARRGGILDIYPITSDQPVRLEFFDIELDSLRTFDVASQRSDKQVDQVQVSPCLEFFPKAEDKEKAMARLKESLDQTVKNQEGEAMNKLESKFSLYLESLEEGGGGENPDHLLAYLDPSSYASLLDYAPDALIAFEDMDRVMETGKEEADFNLQDRTVLLEKGDLLPEEVQTPYSYKAIRKLLGNRLWLNLTQILKRSRTFQPQEIVEVRSMELELFKGRFDDLVERLRTLQARGETSIIFAGPAYKALKQRFKDHNLKVIEAKEGMDPVGKLTISPLYLPKGFSYMDIHFNLITNYEISGTKKKVSWSKKSRPKRRFMDFQDLEEGDLVVHENYGIGRYLGTEIMEIGGVPKDFIKIKYSGSDKLYVPTEDMHLVAKYIGNEGRSPALSSLGGVAWKRAKSRAKKSVAAIADDLVELYAKRSQVKGHAFAPDTPWQADFEEAFPYEETPSQVQATEEIKEDMEDDTPMDRLLCGDVGYGKTEVALRAAFKAVMDGKQVALLAPTTILTQQHYRTMVERFKHFPVRIEFISRFKTPSQQDSLLADLAKGSVDILVGTHRILSKDVHFHDLGLLIIDEEQRFGVKDKEKIKEMKENVDVLTLSATPIPRTLQLSLTGIRDMSLLEEPPEDRYPTSSFVMEWDPYLVEEAIRRELDRGGQVYYVHNRVHDISLAAKKLRDLVPEAKLVVGHGQMTPLQLERVMEDFVSGEANILLATTIIESGLDIPNVNTMIVDDADRMGLAQLYQLKGRIGRSDRKSYAYFTYPANKVVAESAEKRLKAIRDFSDFGSGYKIAMRDLELRGAGNLLGESQSGHIEAIGYDLYVKMLESAIQKIRGEVEEVDDQPEIKVDIKARAYIPDDYISQPADKISAYRRIAGIKSREEAGDLLDEMIDRYGDPPKPVVELFDVSIIRLLASQLGFLEVRERSGYVELVYDSFDRFSVEFLETLSKAYKGPLSFDFLDRDEPKFKLEAGENKSRDTRRLLSLIKDLRKKEKENLDSGRSQPAGKEKQ